MLLPQYRPSLGREQKQLKKYKAQCQKMNAVDESQAEILSSTMH